MHELYDPIEQLIFNTNRRIDMAEKIVRCKRCGAQMFDSIAVCTQCGKKRLSGIQRLIIYAAVAVVLLILILVIRGMYKGAEKDDNKETTAETVATETTDDSGVVYNKNGINLCVKSAEFYGAIGADSGMKFIQVYVSISNTTEDAYAFNLSEYECYAGSKECDIKTPSTASQKGMPLLKTSLVEAGSVTEGYIFFAVPMDTNSIKLRNSVQNTTWKLNLE